MTVPADDTHAPHGLHGPAHAAGMVMSYFAADDRAVAAYPAPASEHRCVRSGIGRAWQQRNICRTRLRQGAVRSMLCRVRRCRVPLCVRLVRRSRRARYAEGGGRAGRSHRWRCAVHCSRRAQRSRPPALRGAAAEPSISVTDQASLRGQAAAIALFLESDSKSRCIISYVQYSWCEISSVWQALAWYVHHHSALYQACRCCMVLYAASGSCACPRQGNLRGVDIRCKEQITRHRVRRRLLQWQLGLGSV